MFIAMLVTVPWSLMAQEDENWPPVEVYIEAKPLENNRFLLTLNFENNAAWVMQDLVIKIPLPPGTRFVEATSLPLTEITFDGQEITLTTNTLGPGGDVPDTYIILESIFPGQTIFTVHPWASWMGGEPGDYLFEELMFDLAAPFLGWEAPYSRIKLYNRATIINRQLTYYTYIQNVEGERIWDVSLKLPLPPNTNVVEALTAPTYTAGFDEKEVSFFSLEPPLQKTFTDPLIVKAKIESNEPFVYFQPYAFWTNFFEGEVTYPQKESATGDIATIEPHLPQWIVADPIGDVPEAPYDLTSAILQRDGESLKITFYTAENLPLLGQGSRYRLYIDLDCSPETGETSTSSWRNSFGMDYRLTYERDQGKARLHQFSKAINDWKTISNVGHWADRQTVTMWLPYQDIAGAESFCWVARADSPRLDFRDVLPDSQNQALTYYDFNWDINFDPQAFKPTPVVDPTPEPPPPDADVVVGINSTVEPLENNRFKLNLNFTNRATWVMQDLIVKIPLPTGTDFVAATGQASTDINFDGQDIWFTSSGFETGGMLESSIILETTSPGQTTFITQPWASWKGVAYGAGGVGGVPPRSPASHAPYDNVIIIGEEEGEHFFQAISISFLNWAAPYTRVKLHNRATIINRQLTHYTYLENIAGGQMWDMSVKVPLPLNTNFVEAIPAPTYNAGYDGQDVNFFSTGPPVQQTLTDPLIVKADFESTAPYIYIQPHAFWANSLADGASSPAQESATGNIAIFEPNLPQWVVTDPIGDVPEPAYDLSNAIFQRDGEALKILLYTAEDLPMLGQGAYYQLYIDLDCSPETGETSSAAWRSDFGMDYRLTYKRDQESADLHQFDEATAEWQATNNLSHTAHKKSVTMWLPYQDLAGVESFCWLARADSPQLDFRDVLPNSQNQALTRYDLNWDAIPDTPEIESNVPAPYIPITLNPPLPIGDVPSDEEVAVEINGQVESLENNRLKLFLNFENNATWVMQDLVVKFSLPAGANFIEASTQATTDLTFDGQEFTFTTNTLGPDGNIESYIILEMASPGQSIFTTQPWASWKGEKGGEHFFEALTFDLAAPFLNWEGPYTRINLYNRATLLDRHLTYYTYVEVVEDNPIWDVTLNIPLPFKSAFVEAIPAPTYLAGFTGQEVSFISIAPPLQQTFSAPLIVKADLQNNNPYTYLQPFFSWTNVYEEPVSYPQKEAMFGDFTILEPDLPQWVVSDPVGDVPELAYDLTNAVFQRDGESLKITLYTAENLPLLGLGSRYRLYIDLDCSPETGETSTSSWRNNFGMDYRLTYERDRAKARLHQFNETIAEWESSTDVGHWADRKSITMWLPYQDLAGVESFCWLARADSPRFDFRDVLPNNQNLSLTYYDINWDIDQDNTKEVLSIAPDDAPDLLPLTKTEDTIEEQVKETSKFCPVVIQDEWQYLPYLHPNCC